MEVIGLWALSLAQIPELMGNNYSSEPKFVFDQQQ